MVLKANGISTVLPSRSTTARLLRIKLVVFLIKTFFNLKTVITIVLPTTPITAKVMMKAPKNTLIPKEISFTKGPLRSPGMEEFLELECSVAIALLCRPANGSSWARAYLIT